MREWFVFTENGEHVGPVTPDLLARGLLGGKVSSDAKVGVDRVAWQPIMTVPEVVDALEALRAAAPAPDAPSTEPSFNDDVGEMTDVMLRDDELKSAIARAKRGGTSSIPPKPPMAPQGMAATITSGSGPPSAPGMPRALRVPSSPGMSAALPPTPTPPPPPLGPPPSARSPLAPSGHGPAAQVLDPAHTIGAGTPRERLEHDVPVATALMPRFSQQQPQHLQPQQQQPQAPERQPYPSQPFHPNPNPNQNPNPSHHPPQQPLQNALGIAPTMFAQQAPGSIPPLPPPPPQAPPQPAASMAPSPSAAPPPIAGSVATAAGSGEKKEEKKAPLVDPKLVFLIPLGTFGVFAFLALILTIYALATKSWLTPEEKALEKSAPAVTTPSK